MTKRWSLAVAVASTVTALVAPAVAFEETVPGKLFAAKPEGKLVKFLAKAPNPPLFPLPSSDPSAGSATLRVFDYGAGGGDDTYDLAGGTWKGLGNPPGSKGYKYKGAGNAADPCKVVLIKEKVIKAVCKDKGAGGVTMTPPFAGTAAIVLEIGADQYCAEFGGTEKKNTEKGTIRKDAPSPASCPTEGESCGDSEYPTCGGTCPSGEVCQATRDRVITCTGTVHPCFPCTDDSIAEACTCVPEAGVCEGCTFTPCTPCDIPFSFGPCDPGEVCTTNTASETGSPGTIRGCVPLEE